MDLGTFLGSLLGAIAGRVACGEAQAWAPRATDSIIEFAVRRLSADRREAVREEWKAYVDQLPGTVAKLSAALGFVFAALRDGVSLTERILAVRFIGGVYWRFLICKTASDYLNAKSGQRWAAAAGTFQAFSVMLPLAAVPFLRVVKGDSRLRSAVNCTKTTFKAISEALSQDVQANRITIRVFESSDGKWAVQTLIADAPDS